MLFVSARNTPSCWGLDDVLNALKSKSLFVLTTWCRDLQLMPTEKERAMFEGGQVVSLHDIDQDAEQYLYSRYHTSF
jgi:hypothetical protein